MKGLTFDDISLIPAPLSYVKSRSEVNTTTKIGSHEYKLGIISSNMDTVYSPELSQQVLKNGGISCVHRFCSIEDNIKLFQAGCFDTNKPWVSIGVGKEELDRAYTLLSFGANVVVIDLANGASIQCLEQFNELSKNSNIDVIVGNFDNSAQIKCFLEQSNRIPAAFKVGVGPGSACITRVITGVGTPSVTSILDTVTTGQTLIFDGGIKQPGDFCKALALGCSAVMMGKNFAACKESAAPLDVNRDITGKKNYKKYRGSASLSSYKIQAKEASHRTPEGEEYLIPISGTVQDLMLKYEAGLRSSMSYLNSRTLTEFKKNAKFLEVTSSSQLEAIAHGKR